MKFLAHHIKFCDFKYFLISTNHRHLEKDIYQIAFYKKLHQLTKDQH